MYLREVYHEFSNIESFINELTWREFFAHVLDAYPEVVGQSYRRNSVKLNGQKIRAILRNGNKEIPVFL